MNKIVLLILGALLAITTTLAQPTPPSDQAQAFASLPTEDLIAKLQDESNQGIGTHATAWASGFLAIDDEPKFNGGIIGSAKPVTSPVMRELVRRGTAALPPLMAHLSDARPTKLILGDGFMGKWFGSEYEPRIPDTSKLPPGAAVRSLNPGDDMKRGFEHYTLKVGDLCFVAIGQIVDRPLNAVRYQPTACLVVNSPIETPALAVAVKKEWSGLTPADHQKSLEYDVLHPTGWQMTSSESLKRLLFYYPDPGAAMAIRLLNQPIYEKNQLATSFNVYSSWIDAMGAFHSAALDQAVYDLLKRTSETHPGNIEDIFQRCELVHSCGLYLARPNAREAFNQSYRQVMSHFPKSTYPHPPDPDQVAAFSKQFQVYLKRETAQLAPK